MIRFYVYLAVIVSGASVLAIEMLGTRIIAPFYGVSLYLWSALISVTLAGLSVGYAVGGHWADRGPKLARFCAVIGLAGIWIALIPWLRSPALAITQAAGLRTAVLITATFLFFPPLTLLGMVSPYAIRLLAASLSVVGRTAGNLYAVSTVASVISAVATGFFLIPSVGVYKMVFIIGVVLVGTAVIGLAVHNKSRGAVVTPLVLAAGTAVILWGAPSLRADPERGLRAVEQSPYGEIRVLDVDDIRYMLIDGGTHTILDRTTGGSLFEYVNVLDIAKLFFEHPGRMLLVGLGGGSVVKSWNSEDWVVDAVEIDPVVTEMAYAHFGLQPDEARVFSMDARKYLITHDDTYDVIVMDAFGSSSIPFHLVTREAFALIRSRLTKDGILAMNIEARAWDDILVRSLAITLEQEFTHVLVLPIAEPPNTLGNLVILASNRPLELEEDPPVPMGRFTAEYHRAHAWDNRFRVGDARAPVLTDDLNPVDVWAEQVNLEARRRLHAFFVERGLTW